MKRLFFDWNNGASETGETKIYRPDDWPDPMPNVGERIVITDLGEDAWEGTVTEIVDKHFVLAVVDWSARVESPEAFAVERVQK